VSYRNLEVWRLARDLTIEIHEMTLTRLPKFEMFEVGQQIRRSIKSVRANIVEGYGRRRYKHDFVRFLVIALASCDETRDHLEVLRDTKSLTNEAVYSALAKQLEQLGKQLNKLVSGVDRDHRSVRESLSPYDVEFDGGADQSFENDEAGIAHPASSIQHPASNEANQSPKDDDATHSHPASSIQDPAS
jgi:four helix bundle protein